jgi:hypothetical protein
LVVRRWWEYLLHNQRVQLLKLMLLLRGKQRIVVVNIPWYLSRSRKSRTSRAAADSEMEDWPWKTM